jgi:F0F1-type ATP synthase assembly protein I
MATADKRDHTVSEGELTRQLNRSHGSFELVVSPLILGLIGWWIDGKAGTGPLFVILLAVMGVLGAIVKIYYEYRANMANVAADSRAVREQKIARRRAEAAERDALNAALERDMADAEARLADGLGREVA